MEREVNDQLQNRVRQELQVLDFRVKQFRTHFQGRTGFNQSLYIDFLRYLSCFNNTFVVGFIDKLQKKELQEIIEMNARVFGDASHKLSNLNSTSNAASQELVKQKIQEHDKQTMVCWKCTKDIRAENVDHLLLELNGDRLENRLHQLIAEQELRSQFEGGDFLFYSDFKKVFDNKEKVLNSCQNNFKAYLNDVAKTMEDIKEFSEDSKPEVVAKSAWDAEIREHINESLTVAFKDKVPPWITKLFKKLFVLYKRKTFKHKATVDTQTDTVKLTRSITLRSNKSKSPPNNSESDSQTDSNKKKRKKDGQKFERQVQNYLEEVLLDQDKLLSKSLSPELLEIVKDLYKRGLKEGYFKRKSSQNKKKESQKKISKKLSQISVDKTVDSKIKRPMKNSLKHKQSNFGIGGHGDSRDSVNRTQYLKESLMQENDGEMEEPSENSLSYEQLPIITEETDTKQEGGKKQRKRQLGISTQKSAKYSMQMQKSKSSKSSVARQFRTINELQKRSHHPTNTEKSQNENPNEPTMTKKGLNLKKKITAFGQRLNREVERVPTQPNQAQTEREKDTFARNMRLTQPGRTLPTLQVTQLNRLKTEITTNTQTDNYGCTCTCHLKGAGRYSSTLKDRLASLAGHQKIEKTDRSQENQGKQEKQQEHLPNQTELVLAELLENPQFSRYSNIKCLQGVFAKLFKLLELATQGDDKLLPEYFQGVNKKQSRNKEDRLHRLTIESPPLAHNRPVQFSIPLDKRKKQKQGDSPLKQVQNHESHQKPHQSYSKPYFSEKDIFVFITKENAITFQMIQKKGVHFKSKVTFTPKQLESILNIYQLMHLISLQNSKAYQEVCAFIRYPYQTAMHDFSVVNIIKGLSEKSFLEYFELLSFFHKDCRKKGQVLCEHIKHFHQKLQDILIKVMIQS